MSKKNLRIHFVCRGNSFRSRLAEAYLNSKKISSIKATSSGICADENLDGPITWYGLRIIKNENLIRLMSNYWKKTAKKIIAENDLIIFMTKRHYNFCKNFLNGKKFEIWDIDDIENVDNLTHADNKIIKSSENIYKKIKKEVDNLVLRNKWL
jgi:protein-tyrosine-phosphatase